MPRGHTEMVQALNQKGYFSAVRGSGNLRRVQGNKIKTANKITPLFPVIKIVLLSPAGYKEDLVE